MGDPGAAERLSMPRYAYIFIVFREKQGGYDVHAILGQDLYDGKSGDSEVWQPVNTGADGDIIYRCLINFTENTPVLGTIDQCRVYAAVSKVPLTLKTGGSIIDNSHLPTDEAQVRGITFTVDDDLQAELQNIYSTPCNYLIDETYYAQFDIWHGHPSAEIILYHVASKVDLMWNVPEEAQTEIHVTKIKAKNLFQGDSYLFKSTENIHSQFTDLDGYTPTDLAGDIAGTWWAGRKYFYTIPYRTSAGGQFPLQVDFDVKNTSEDRSYTYALTMTSSVPEVFVPWMRGQLTFSTAPTANRTISINVDN